jgi:hypothetical protein
MAITTADGWFAASKQKILIQKTATATTVAATTFSIWDKAGNPGAGSLGLANATPGVIQTDVTAGAPLINSFGSGATGYLAAGRFRNTVAGSLILYDRIYVLGPITLTAAASVAITTPPSFSSRVPGGTDYTNTEILVELATTNSAANTTVAFTYTNQSGAGTRTSGTTAQMNAFTVGRVMQVPLQAGDSGVQKLETYTITTTGTGTANFIIARRLAVFDVRIANAMDAQAWDMIGGPIVYADSCLWPVVVPDSTSSGTPTLDLDLING